MKFCDNPFTQNMVYNSCNYKSMQEKSNAENIWSLWYTQTLEVEHNRSFIEPMEAI